MDKIECPFCHKTIEVRPSKVHENAWGQIFIVCDARRHFCVDTKADTCNACIYLELDQNGHYIVAKNQ